MSGSNECPENGSGSGGPGKSWNVKEEHEGDGALSRVDSNWVDLEW